MFVIDITSPLLYAVAERPPVKTYLPTVFIITQAFLPRKQERLFSSSLTRLAFCLPAPSVSRKIGLHIHSSGRRIS